MFKKILRRILARNEFESLLLRKLFARWYGINIGMYSYGCFDPKRIPGRSVIGRYCSFSPSCVFFARDHGLKFISLHPYLYNSTLGMIETDTIPNSSRTIEDDVWVGHNAIVMSKVDFVGRGSVIAAGSVVTKNVPRYAIVAGNPATILRYRFSPEIIDAIEKTRWWTLSKSQLADLISSNPELVFDPERHHA